MKCKKCTSLNTVKYGNINGNQRYKCTDCNCQFQPNRNRGRPESTKRLAILLYLSGLSMRTISKVVHTDLHAVYRWIRIFAEENYEKPEPEPEPASDAIVVELDEMWHYIQKKKQNLDVEGFFSQYPSTYRLGVWRER